MLVKNHSRAQARRGLYDPRQVLVTRGATKTRAYGPSDVFVFGNYKSWWFWIDQMHYYICTEFHNSSCCRFFLA